MTLAARNEAARAEAAERQALRESVRRVLEHESPLARVRAVAEEALGYDPALWRKMAELGWLGLAIPEAYGGSGAGFADLAVVLEELGRHLTPSPLLASSVLGAAALVRSENEAERLRWLPGLAAGTLRASVALTGARGRPGEISVHAKTVGRDLVLEGAAGFVPDASGADVHVVAARDDEGRVAIVTVPASATGYRVDPLDTVDQTRRLHALRFEGARVGGDAVLARGEAGGRLLDALVDRASIALACDALGGAERAMEMAVAHARQRVQFGRVIGSFQAVKHKCADMFVLVESARVAVARAVELVDQGGDREVAIAAMIAGSYAREAYAKLAGDSIQVHGGMGYTWECDAHLYLKRAKLDQALFGDPAWQRERLASRIIPAPPSS